MYVRMRNAHIYTVYLYGLFVYYSYILFGISPGLKLKYCNTVWLRSVIPKNWIGRFELSLALQ